jgi:hypothetical protein
MFYLEMFQSNLERSKKHNVQFLIDLIKNIFNLGQTNNRRKSKDFNFNEPKQQVSKNLILFKRVEGQTDRRTARQADWQSKKHQDK